MIVDRAYRDECRRFPVMHYRARCDWYHSTREAIADHRFISGKMLIRRITILTEKRLEGDRFVRHA